MKGAKHIWVGSFESKEAFEAYFDQEPYLKAWYIYDNEPATGKEEDDKEPDPELRCKFCKEIGIDTYDEDFIVLKYYQDQQQINHILDDVPGNSEEFLGLCEKYGIGNTNVLIAYENRDLNQEAASKAEKLLYLGQIESLPVSGEVTGLITHYLWVGENEISSIILDSLNKGEELSEDKIAEILGIDRKAINTVNIYYTADKKRADEIIVIQVEDYIVAEQMVLKAGELGITSTNLMLELISNQNLIINPENKLGLIYIGDFRE
jgi:hypothetical protein